MNCFLYSLCDAFYSFPTDSYQFSFFRFVSIYNDRASPARWLLSLQTPSKRVNLKKKAFHVSAGELESCTGAKTEN